MDYVLKATNDYKKFKALNNLTMSIPKGSIYGIPQIWFDVKFARV